MTDLSHREQETEKGKGTCVPGDLPQSVGQPIWEQHYVTSTALKISGLGRFSVICCKEQTNRHDNPLILGS